MPRGGGKGGTLLRARSFKLRLEHDLFFIYRKFLESRKNWRRINSVTLQGFCPPCGNRQDTKRKERRTALLLCRSARRSWSDWPACACIASRFAFTMPASLALLLRFLRAFQYMQTVWERMNRNEAPRNERAVCLLLLFFCLRDYKTVRSGNSLRRLDGAVCWSGAYTKTTPSITPKITPKIGDTE